MKVTLLAAGGLALALVGAAHAGAKITPAQAKASAVSKIPGKALSAKYEFEDGRWQYAVVVQKGKALYEVEVNAQTGRVLDTEKTSLAEEKAEAAADKKATAHKTPAQKAGSGDTEKTNPIKPGAEKADVEKK